MRHQREIRAVAGFQEEGHAGDEAEHGMFVMWVREADGEEEDAGDDADEVDPDLLAPDVAVAVDDIGYDAASGAEGDVEKAEHGGPAAGASLKEVGEVLDVVGAEYGINGELSAERAKVAACQDKSLRAEDDGESFFEAGFLDYLAAGCVEHLLLPDLGFVVMVGGVLAGGAVADFFSAVATRWTVGAGAILVVCEAARHVDDRTGDAMTSQVLFSMYVAVCPFATGCVGTEQKHANGSGCN